MLRYKTEIAWFSTTSGRETKRVYSYNHGARTGRKFGTSQSSEGSAYSEINYNYLYLGLYTVGLEFMLNGLPCRKFALSRVVPVTVAV